jgi:purine-binding chemotaxis protein CheW
VKPEITGIPFDGLTASMNDNTRQVLTFSLGAEIYGVDIRRVKEIRGWSPVTRIPQSAPSLLGVLNLRGAIVPVIDLRVRFALASTAFTPVTVIIVLSLQTPNGQRECGIVVDNVNDVLDVATDAIKPAPDMGQALTTRHIEGIAAHEQQMLILLNADTLVSPELSHSTTDPELADRAA